MALSLRLIIAAVSAISVLSVAAFTLALTTVSGLRALRSVGTDLAASLVRHAETEMHGYLHDFTIPLVTMQNWTYASAWPWPSDDAATLTSLRTTFQAAARLNTHQIASFGVYCADHTGLQAAVHPATPALYTLTARLASPFGAGAALPGDRTYTFDKDVRYRSSHQQVLASDPDYNRTPTPYPPVAINVSWGGFVGWTAENDGALVSPFGIRYDAADAPVIDLQLLAVAPLVVAGKTRDAAARRAEDLFGFATATMSTTAISAFLRRLKVTSGTTAWAFERSGVLLGASEPGPVAVTFNEPRVGDTCAVVRDLVGLPVGSTYICRRTTVDYGNNALASLPLDVLNPPPGSPKVGQFHVDEGRFYVASTRVSHFKFEGLEIYIALMVPEEDVVGDVARTRWIVVGAVLGMVLVLVAVNAAVVWYTLSPLQLIAARMERASSLTDDAPRDPPSATAEVRRLEDAYYDMNDELLRIRSYVPQAVLLARRESVRLDESADMDGQLDLTLTARQVQSHPSTRVTPLEGALEDHNSPTFPLSLENSLSGGRTESRPSLHATIAGIGSMRVSTVTVVAINLEGFHPALLANEMGATRALVRMVEVAEEAVGSRSGVLVFHGDHIMATFNAARTCLSHGRRGVESAAVIAAALFPPSSSSPDAHSSPSPILRVRCGIATGVCTVGNIGSQHVKTFCTMGPAYSGATQLERLARRYGVGCTILATQRTCTEVLGSCRAAFVDLIGMRGREGAMRATLIAAVLPAVGPASRDEWLYVLEGAAGERSGVQQRNKLYERLQQGVVPDSVMDPENDKEWVAATGLREAGIEDRLLPLLARARTAASTRSREFTPASGEDWDAMDPMQYASVPQFC